MNERIKELANRANIQIDKFKCVTGRNSVDLLDVELEKFAELIVKECIEQMDLVRKYRYDRVQPLENQQTIIDECQYQIKQYFGVE